MPLACCITYVLPPPPPPLLPLPPGTCAATPNGLLYHAPQVINQHKAWMEGKDVRGRIYISEQGINAQYGGVKEDAVGYAQWLEQQPMFKVRWPCYCPAMGLRWTGVMTLRWTGAPIALRGCLASNVHGLAQWLDRQPMFKAGCHCRCGTLSLLLGGHAFGSPSKAARRASLTVGRHSLHC